MLNAISVQEAVELAKVLQEQGYFVEAIPETPVSVLARANYTGDLMHTVNLKGSEAQCELMGQAALVASRTFGTDKVPEHDLAQTDILERVAGVVATGLDLAKNQIVPHVLRVLEDVVKRSELTAIRDLNNILVIPDMPFDIWSNATILELCEKHRTTPPSDLKLRDLVEAPSNEQATSWLFTGMSSIDNDIAQMLASKPYLPLEALEGVFFNVFNGGGVMDVMNPYKVNRDVLMVRYLAARHLLSNIPDNGKVNLSDLRASLTDIMIQAAVAICAVLRLQERAVANNVLLRSFPVAEVGTGKEIIIHVNGVVYNRWLEAGGSPEIVMGSFVTDRETSYAELLAKGEFYTKAWARHCRTRANVIAEGRFNRTLMELRHCMIKEITEAAPNLGVPKEALFERLNAELTAFKLDDLSNFPAFVRDLVCKVLYAHGDALVLLTEMDRVKIANPSFTMDECATEAYAEILSDWVAAQLIAKRLSL